MKTTLLTSFLFLFSLPCIYPQQNHFSYDLRSSAGFITPGHVPFWLRSNQFGSIPVDNASLGLSGAVRKDYDRSKTRVFDWGAAVEGRANIGHTSNFTLIEGYGKIRIGVFEFRGGRSREIMGLCDTSLSSGSFAESGNVTGIPKLQISIPEFYSLPVFDKIFAFKGNYVHGWIGETSFTKMDTKVITLETWLHQKSLYGRFGKPGWKFKIYGGFNHQVLWGNEKEAYGDSYTFSPLMTYLKVITGGKYLDYIRIGDALGSIDLGFEYTFKNVRILAYRQNIYEAGALYYLANIRDGLNGLSLVNLRYTRKGFQWHKILAEVFYTKSQGGETWSVPRTSGAENYYNNWQYIKGWSYKGIGIGNPFICTDASTRVGVSTDPINILIDPFNYFINNRIIVFHLGYEGSVQEWNIKLKTSYSLNYGAYRTIETFGEKKQLSAYFETDKELKKGLSFGFTGAFDAGELYYNSIGMIVRVAKTF